MDTPEHAFRAAVTVVLDRLRAQGHEVPDDLLREIYQAVARNDSVQVDFICPRCWNFLRIEFDDWVFLVEGTLLGPAPENICHATSPFSTGIAEHMEPGF